MRRPAFLLTLSLVLALTTGTAFAQTCNSPTAYGACCGVSWVEYSPDISSSCYTKDPGIDPTTLSCGFTGYDFRSYSKHITRTFTIADPGSTHWEVQFNVDLIDPHQSWWNQIDARLSIYRPSTGTVTHHSVYTRNGTQGDVSCATPYLTFYAQQGDVITIDFLGAVSWPDSHVKIGNVRFFRMTP